MYIFLILSFFSLYQQELEQARWFNQRLGYGIAGFQGLTNLAINGILTCNIHVLYSMILHITMNIIVF